MNSTSVYVLNFRNYYDRIVHPYLLDLPQGGFIDVYYEAAVASFNNINFNPNDGIDTELILNLDEGVSGNYLITLNPEDNYNVSSRWYIIESQRTRGGQYRLILHRDVITDYWNIIRSSKALIEKCTLNAESPFVFNDEAMTVNQIKTSETLLKDSSKCAWLVGYYDRNKISEISGTVPANNIIPGAIQLSEDIENWEYWDYCTNNPDFNGIGFIGTPSLQQIGIRTLGLLGDNTESAATYFRIADNAWTSYTLEDWDRNTKPTLKSYAGLEGQTCERLEAKATPIISQLNSYAEDYAPITSSSQFDSFMRFQGATIRDAQGRYYAVHISPHGEYKQYNSVSAGSLYNSLSTIVNSMKMNESDKNVSGFKGSINSQSFFVYVEAKKYVIDLERLVTKETTYQFKSGAIKTLDAPWNIFAMPYAVDDTNLTITDYVNNVQLTTINNNIYLNAAMAMQKAHPGIIYDIQLLPYCPIPGLVSDRSINLVDASSFTPIKSGEETLGYILHVPSSSFSINLLDYTVPGGKSAIEKKVNNQCDKWRLAAPNYSSYFDFSVEKNNGVAYFNVDCNYKPYTPYIHINPAFNGLYGYDDNSPRGLVLGGDFSLSQVIDQWQQYQIQNKNFQEIFDRQIQNMEVRNDISRVQEKWGIATGTVMGGTSGAAAGMMIGGGWGAAIGGVVGTGASLGGGIADYRLSEKLRNETLDYTKDNFGYQLGNIQALPQTISKVSAFNANNKIFPVLEYYTCTDEEKVAFLNKVAYNGMTTMVIGTIVNYVESQAWTYDIGNRVYESQGYLKCVPIRFGDGRFAEDYHVATVIAEELNKGIYIKRSYN